MKEVSAKKLSTRKPKRRSSAEVGPEKKDGDQRYELVDFVVKHFRMSSWKDYKGQKYSAQDILHLLEDITALFRMEKSLCHISPPVTIVGDLNGQFQDLIRIFNIKNEKCKKEDEWKQVFATEKFVFLGDYTENGQFNLETICLLFGLKMLYPQRYVLLRGHQETCISSEFHDQLLQKFPGLGDEICQKFRTVFSLLPVAAVVGDAILCVHGGITPDIKRSVEELRKIPKSEDLETLNPIVRDLLFACPIDDDGIGAESEEPIYFMSVQREYTKMFNEAAVRAFCEKTKIQLIVRSHEVPINGFRFFADKKMITIFSAAAYHNYNNKAAFLRVDTEGVVSIVQMRPTEKKYAKKEEKKKSGENVNEKKTESGEKLKDSKEKTKASNENTNGSGEKAEKKERKKATSKPSKEIESLYDNISEKRV